MNENYNRNILLLLLIIIVTAILIIAFTDNYLEGKKVELPKIDLETEDVIEGVPEGETEEVAEGETEEEVEGSKDIVIAELGELLELLEEGYTINLNGYHMTRVTKEVKSYDIYGIDDDNKIVYITYRMN